MTSEGATRAPDPLLQIFLSASRRRKPPVAAWRCHHPRVGGSRPAPCGTLTAPVAGLRVVFCLSQRHRRQRRRGLCPRRVAARVGSGATRASDGSRGHPDDAQHWRGQRAPVNAVGALSAAKGEGAQRPKRCRRRRPPSAARCHRRLCPLPISLVSGASAEDREGSCWCISGK